MEEYKRQVAKFRNVENQLLGLGALGIESEKSTAYQTPSPTGCSYGYVPVASLNRGTKVLVRKVMRTDAWLPYVLIAGTDKEGTKAKIKTLKTIGHHNHLLDFVEAYDPSGSDPMVIMEFCPFPTLETLLASDSAIGYSSYVLWMSQTSDALAYLHENHLVFKELKPDRVYVRPGQRLAVVLSNYTANDLDDEQQTQMTKRFRAPEWLARPKLCENGPPPLVDIWSLGAIALLFYKQPVRFIPPSQDEEGSSMGGKNYVNQIQQDKKNAFSRFESDPFLSVISKMLEEEPDDRPTASECLQQLKDVLKAQKELRKHDDLHRLAAGRPNIGPSTGTMTAATGDVAAAQRLAQLASQQDQRGQRTASSSVIAGPSGHTPLPPGAPVISLNPVSLPSVETDDGGYENRPVCSGTQPASAAGSAARHHGAAPPSVRVPRSPIGGSSRRRSSSPLGPIPDPSLRISKRTRHASGSSAAAEFLGGAAGYPSGDSRLQPQLQYEPRPYLLPQPQCQPPQPQFEPQRQPQSQSQQPAQPQTPARKRPWESSTSSCPD
ncbi:kinase-like domain-containing protein [Diplogelasinospora grovesii]|uniref:Kinase-like domain-containing protein n=1 Tax=Diplogelasinospora grovesii TaxID=303347 RepID=A0AAN6MU51_9PEZI|nr:kinase-like domain-containing protein [Diplogelasinospora grovesii]